MTSNALLYTVVSLRDIHIKAMPIDDLLRSFSRSPQNLDGWHLARDKHDFNDVARAYMSAGLKPNHLVHGAYWRYFAFPDGQMRRHVIVVDIDGACHGNGTTTSRASYGIFFGITNQMNRGESFVDAYPATSQRAELKAACVVLQSVLNNSRTRPMPTKRPQLLVIRSDSEYTVSGITSWIYTWRGNGWKTAGGKPVSNVDLWQDLSALIDAVEARTKLTVAFWKVDRSVLKAAHNWAQKGLAR